MILNPYRFAQSGSQVNQIPVMTGSTTPSGVASASSTYDGYSEAWRAFDGARRPSSVFGWASSAATPYGWLQYQFPTAKIITGYRICPAFADNGTQGLRAPKNWTFEGSNNGTTWTVLDTQSEVVDWPDMAGKAFSFSNSTAFLYYRLNVSALKTYDDFVEVMELEMYG